MSLEKESEKESENERVENERTHIHRDYTSVYAIRAPNCCRRVTGDYFLIAAIKREQDHHGSVRALSAFDVRGGRNAFSTGETACEKDLRGGSNVQGTRESVRPWGLKVACRPTRCDARVLRPTSLVEAVEPSRWFELKTLVWKYLKKKTRRDI